MYANPDYLVETQWLADSLGDPRLRLFDVTGMLIYFTVASGILSLH